MMLGDKLRRAGLTPNALLSWSGTHRLSALRSFDLHALPVVPAASALALFVAGRELAVDTVARVLPLDELADLVERTGERVRARVAILPLEQALLVCDRSDAPDDTQRVCWPDDSS